jgi:hypothetical protein
LFSQDLFQAIDHGRVGHLPCGGNCGLLNHVTVGWRGKTGQYDIAGTS